jgi:rhomboid family protein
MGLENRDYIRESPPPAGFGIGPRGYWAVKFLLIANIVVFVLQLAGRNPAASPVTQWLDLRLAQQVATTVAPADAAFYKIDLENGRPPRNVSLPVQGAANAPDIPAGTSVEPVGVSYGHYTLVRWEGRYGLVRTESLSATVTTSYWQLAWRLLTYGFCHGGFYHILFNMFVLWMFGRLIEPIFGSLEFLLFFLAGVVVSGLAHVGYILAMGTNIPAVGASGGVMAVVFLTAMIYPREKVYIFGIIPMEMRVMAVLYAVIDVVGALNPHSGTAHWAHLGGAAFGVAYHHYHWRLSGFWIGLRKRFSGAGPRGPRPRVRVYQPEEPEPQNSDIDAQVDRLLEKISQHGEASLTDKERTFLAEASRRYRKR